MVLTEFCVTVLLGSFLVNASVVEWTRTAQGTNDRLTPQPQVEFANDFAFSQSITVDRYIVN